MVPSELMVFRYEIVHFGQVINEKKHKMRGGYKKKEESNKEEF